MTKFTHFLKGPNGPRIFSRRTKTDFKDRGSKVRNYVIFAVLTFSGMGKKVDFYRMFFQLAPPKKSEVPVSK